MKKIYILLIATLLIFTGCDNELSENKTTTKTTTTTEVASTHTTQKEKESTTLTTTTKPLENEKTTTSAKTTTTMTTKKSTTTTKATNSTTTKKTTTTTKKSTTTTKKTTTKKTTTTTTKAPTTTTTKKPTTTVKNANEKQVYNAMIALKSKYPNGTSWTNSNYYEWKGGIFSGGYGCAGFAFMLSDAAFGSAPAKKHTNFDNVKVGDILRINYDSHSVIVLEVKSNSFIVAEGNYNMSVHWGREISLSEVKSTGTYVLTRW